MAVLAPRLPKATVSGEGGFVSSSSDRQGRAFFDTLVYSFRVLTEASLLFFSFECLRSPSRWPVRERDQIYPGSSQTLLSPARTQGEPGWSCDLGISTIFSVLFGRSVVLR